MPKLELRIAPAKFRTFVHIAPGSGSKGQQYWKNLLSSPYTFIYMTHHSNDSHSLSTPPPPPPAAIGGDGGGGGGGFGGGGYRCREKRYCEASYY